jgi:hypothetical protein
VIVATTPIGYGCRVEGPHGPAACDPGDMLDGSVCACGCSVYGDCCDVYGEWSLEQHRMDSLAPPRVRTSDTTGHG